MSAHGSIGTRAARTVVASLTDEEIDALTDGAHDIVVLPHLSLLGHEEAQHARRAAERSLLARGVLLPVPPGIPDGGEGASPQVVQDEWGAEGAGAQAGERSHETVAVHDLLAPLLQLRKGAPVVAVLHRSPTGELAGSNTGELAGGVAPAVSMTRYLFVLDGACVCEDVTAQGVHTLSMARTQQVAMLVAEFLVPAGAQAPAGSDEIVTDPSDLQRTLRRLGHPVLLAETTVLHPWQGAGSATARLLTLGPGGCYHADLGVGSRWVCRPAHPDDLVGLVVEEVAAALARVTAEVDGHNGERD